jgi:hypothetical protein
LKSSSIKSSDTSAKYSWPISEQNDEIHDSGAPSEDDMLKEPESDEKVDVDIELKSSLSRPSASVGAVSPDTLSRVGSS